MGWPATRTPAAGITGMAASPGVAEGRARVVHPRRSARRGGGGRDPRRDDHRAVLGTIFGKIGAAVTDIGGMMSHAAIVCREYGLPAVTGTGSGTTTIRTGQLLRVDGGTGRVEILEG